MAEPRKLYTQEYLDASVAAALREAANLMPRHYGVWSATGVHIGVWDDGFTAAKVLAEYPGGVMRDMIDAEAILALIPDAGAALDRALAAQRERLATWLETHEAGHTTRGWTVSPRPENSPGTHAGMAYAAAIRAQGDKT